MHPQHTAIMVEPDEVSSSTPCSSSTSIAHSHHSRSVRPPAGATTVCFLQQAPTACKECQKRVVITRTELRAGKHLVLAPSCCTAERAFADVRAADTICEAGDHSSLLVTLRSTPSVQATMRCTAPQRPLCPCCGLLLQCSRPRSAGRTLMPVMPQRRGRPQLPLAPRGRTVQPLRSAQNQPLLR